MKRCFLSVFLVAAGLSVSCGGINPGTPGTASFTWDGTWTSDQTFHVRGTFTLDADRLGRDLSGSLVLYDGSHVELESFTVTGEVYEEYDIGFDVILHISFETEDGTIRFNGSSNSVGIDDLADTPFVTGEYTNDGDAGDWHTLPSGTLEDCVIESAVQTSPALSIRDLCSNGTMLYAVVNVQSSTAVYGVNPATGAAAEIGSLCDDPRGIAYDGAYFWIVAENAADGYDLYKYDAAWSVQTGYPKPVTGELFGSTIEAVGWHEGKIICPAFFYLNYLDPATAVITSGGGLGLRAAHADGDGTNLWMTYTAPGYDWSAFLETGSGSSVIRDILTPDLAAQPFTIEGNHLWTASINGGLYRISLQ